MVQGVSEPSQTNKEAQRATQLGPVLCWAVVFADIGTSIYYVPGILYGNVGSLAGFFVFLTMSVFVLLTLKYAEVTHRFPQGGGVVTVAAQAMNHWVGALGGMFILVDYFLTAAISCLSGMLYLSVVIPAMGPFALEITLGVLVLLGILNWIGASESAKVSLLGATVAFLSDIAILITVFMHISFPEFLSLFPKMFANHELKPISLLIGFAGSFLAFSGLESISQLSPVMKSPRKRVSAMALLFVVLTVGLTSPLLTLFSTLLLPKKVIEDPVLSAQVISLLAGHWGNSALQTEVAVSASALLVFASNTAIIGAYHVFLALSRMQFFPEFLLRRNKLRGTPHYSIFLATLIPMIILLLVRGNIMALGDMYAFGLLGAFTLTCLGLDIIRHRERKAARTARGYPLLLNTSFENAHDSANASNQERTSPPESLSASDPLTAETPPSPYRGTIVLNLWYTFKFYIGLLTTVLVVTAWTTNLVAKPLATAFGGTVTVVGMAVAAFTYARHRRMGKPIVLIQSAVEHLPGSTLGVLWSESKYNDVVIHSAIQSAQAKPVVFLYLGSRSIGQRPRMFEFHDSYHDDEQAKRTFDRAERLAQEAHARCLFLYRQQEPSIVEHVWHIIHPYDTVIAAEKVASLQDINPDRIRYEVLPQATVAHLLKRW
ncbi:MAG TPA: APC family permease [Ktedonobacteraceae bacterium]|jgi:amino acid transporter